MGEDFLAMFETRKKSSSFPKKRVFSCCYKLTIQKFSLLNVFFGNRTFLRVSFLLLIPFLCKSSNRKKEEIKLIFHFSKCVKSYLSENKFLPVLEVFTGISNSKKVAERQPRNHSHSKQIPHT